MKISACEARQVQAFILERNSSRTRGTEYTLNLKTRRRDRKRAWKLFMQKVHQRAEDKSLATAQSESAERDSNNKNFLVIGFQLRVQWNQSFSWISSSATTNDNIDDGKWGSWLSVHVVNVLAAIPFASREHFITSREFLFTSENFNYPKFAVKILSWLFAQRQDFAFTKL